MRIRILRTAALSVAACGLAADAALAADAPPGAAAMIAVPGTEYWSLRSDRAVSMTPRAKVVPISQMPDERRSVRIVYQGYGEANLLRTDR